MGDNKKRILIFSLAYHPFIGGAEVAIKEITDRLGDSTQSGQGFCFDLITSNLDGQQKAEERIDNINVYRIGFGKIGKYLFPLAAYQLAKKLHQKNNYNLIWSMMANQAGWAALKFKKKFPLVKYLLTIQEGDSEFDIMIRTWFMRPVYKSIYQSADQIQAISNFLKKRAQNLGAKCPIEVVPNGVKVESRKLKVKSQGKKIITVSRLVEKNGIEYLIKAMKDVDGELIILGSGKLEAKLKILTKNLNLENKIEFLGEVLNNQVYEYLNNADVFVRPSLSEGLGNAFLEAMAVGIPVIGTKVGGIPDFLEDGKVNGVARDGGLGHKTGYFCEVKNPKSIAEKINYILDEKNKEEVEIVVDNARKMVEEKYNWDNISIKIKNIFIKLINN